MVSYNYNSLIIGQLIPLIENQLTTYFNIDISDLNVSRNFQSTTQFIGAEEGAKKYQVYLSPTTSPSRVGRGFKVTSTDSGTVTNEYQEIKSCVIQVDCFANYDPEDNTSIEGMDLAELVSEMLMQQDVIETLTAIGIYPENCTQVRPAFSIDNKSQFESTPSFDYSLTYNSNYVKSLDKVTSVEGTIYRV